MPCMRWVFAVLAFMGIAGCYILRLNLSVVMTVIARTNHDASPRSHDNATTQACKAPNSSYSVNRGDANSSVIDFKEAEFQWSSHTQELLLAAFYIGTTPVQPFAGWAVDRYGGKWLLASGVCLSAIMNMLAPVAARTAVPLFVAVRVVSGIGEAFCYSGVSTMVTKWAPANEQTRMMAFIISGLGLGGASGQILSGVICAYIGWETTFYIFGGCMLIWFVLWSLLVHEEPSNHPCISVKESSRIETGRLRGSKANLKKSVPICSLMTSLPALAWITTMVTIAGFVVFILLTNIPLYLKHVQGLSVDQIGFLVSIPYMVHLIATIAASNVSDLVVKRNWLTRTHMRKLAINIGSIILAASLLSIVHARCSLALSIGLMSTAMGGMGIADAGIFVNHMDLAPRFAGTLFGIGNAISVSTGFIGPLIVASFTEDQNDPRGWGHVFYFTAGLTMLGAIVFQLFGSGDEQEWAKDIDFKLDVELAKTNGETTDSKRTPFIKDNE